MDSTKALIIASIPVGLLAIGHIKSLPLVYTLRSWLLLRSILRKAKNNDMRPVPLFNVIQQEHYCCLDDIDYNQHMNNGMYNKILDFNRIELIYSVLPKAILEPDHHIFAHNAGVVTLFKKEIPPFAKYRTEGRFYSWDDKWIILQHRFVLEDDTVACYAFSKIVFKKLSGKTVAPETVFKLCGHDLTDKEIEERRARNWETAQHFLSLDKAKEDPYPWKSKL